MTDAEWNAAADQCLTELGDLMEHVMTYFAKWQDFVNEAERRGGSVCDRLHAAIDEYDEKSRAFLGQASDLTP